MDKKLEKRLDQLMALGLRFNFGVESYILEDLNVHTTEISFMRDEAWDALINKFTDVIVQRYGNEVLLKTVKEHLFKIKGRQESESGKSFYIIEVNCIRKAEGLECNGMAKLANDVRTEEEKNIDILKALKKAIIFIGK